MKLWGEDGMLAGAFHKSFIKKAHLIISGVSQGLGGAVGSLGRRGTCSAHL